MKKVLLCPALLLFCLAAAAPLAAAECPPAPGSDPASVAAMTPVPDSPAPAPNPAAPVFPGEGAGLQSPQPAAGCPLYRVCMKTVEGACLCPGFYCNGQFICGVPVAWP